MLMAYVNQEKLSVGDVVVLNELGRHRYRFPQENQVAIVSSVFKEPIIDKDRDVQTGEISVVQPCQKHGLSISSYPTDLRCYTKVKETAH